MIKLESVLDRPAETLDPRLFDKSGDIRPAVPFIAEDRFFKAIGSTFVAPKKWLHFYLIGSAVTYQWSESCDLDVTVEMNPAAFSKYEFNRTPEEALEILRGLAQKINGQDMYDNVPIPVNYYVRTDMRVSADAMYDLTINRWVKEPNKPDGYDPEHYWEVVWDEARQVAQGWDIDTGKLRRDIIDLGVLKRDMSRLSNRDITSLKFRAIAQEGKIIAEILDLIQDYDDLHDERMRILSSPDEDSPEQVIHDYKSWVPINVLYKILERYSYVQFLHDLKTLSHERGVDDDVLNEIHNMLALQRHADAQDDARKVLRRYMHRLYGRDSEVYNHFIGQLTRRWQGYSYGKK